MRKFIIMLVACSLFILPITSFAKVNEVELSISSKSAILVDSQSGRVLYEKNADQPLPIASVTKVMTLLLVFEAIDNGNLSLDEMITVSENASGMGGSQAFIDAGYNYSAEELIKSIIIASANDSAVAMAERISGSEEAFVSKMNNKANELKMTNTVFKNCTGLPEAGHHSSARDVSIMSNELLKHDKYFKWGTIWMDEIKHEKDGRVTELVNTNRLIRSLQGCDGLKTGYTSEAGFCVSTTAKRGNMRLVSVILNGNTSKERFNDAEKLINYGFANYSNDEIIKAGECLAEIPLDAGVEDKINAISLENYSLCVKNDGSDIVETRIEIPEKINAPIKEGQDVGKIVIILNGQEVEKITLKSDKEYIKAGFIERLKKIISFWN